MMTSSNGNIFRVTGHLCGEFHAQRPVTRSFDVFFDLRRIKGLNKQSWDWWFETLSRPLWRHNNAVLIIIKFLPQLQSFSLCCHAMLSSRHNKAEAKQKLCLCRGLVAIRLNITLARTNLILLLNYPHSINWYVRWTSNQ